MARSIEEVSTITAKGQTTVPKSVRKALGVDLGGQIAFRIQGGRVTVERVADAHEDPALGKFLSLLAEDLERNPKRIKPLSRELAARIRKLTKGVRVDPNAEIEGDVEL